MEEGSLKGLRCVGLTRCSTVGQSGRGLSNDQQAEILRAYCARQQMLWVGEERAEGISGSRTEGRQDIENLMYRAEFDPEIRVTRALMR